MNEETFFNALYNKGIQLTEDQLKQFELYYELLVSWNEKMNLTAITNKEEVYLKHFYDSLTAAFSFDFSFVHKVADVGAGAGFPSIPIKICFPHLQVTIVDSLKKRITFLEELTKSLKLNSVNLYHDRAESFGKLKDHRESYDIVTARAVARLSVLSELCLPLVKVNGTFLALKGSKGNEEVEDAKKALSILGASVSNVTTLYLPGEDAERNIYTIEKDKPTPKKYPRNPGLPAKNPLS